jgi:hypothetical protein
LTWNTAIWIGFGLVAIGAVLALREHLWIRDAQIVPGTVVEMIATRGSKGGMSYKPRVQFTAKDGSNHEFLRGYSSSPPGFVVGERIAVAYDPVSYEGRILTFGQRFGFASILVAVGCAAIIMATTFITGRQVVPRIYIQRHSEF